MRDERAVMRVERADKLDERADMGNVVSDMQDASGGFKRKAGLLSPDLGYGSRQYGEPHISRGGTLCLQPDPLRGDGRSCGLLRLLAALLIGSLFLILAPGAGAAPAATAKAPGSVSAAATGAGVPASAPVSATQTAGAASPADWLIMIYLAADNDLEVQSFFDLLEMESAKPDNVEVLVLVDRSPGEFDGWQNWSGARIYRVARGGTLDPAKFYPGLRRGKTQLPDTVASPVIMDLGQVNSADPRILRDFLNYGIRNYPARRHAFVAWDHGGGWPMMLYDGSAGEYMNGEQFSSAVREAAGALPRGRFDLIVMDLCLMAQVDFLYYLKDLADYVAASAPPVPGFGTDYQTFLRAAAASQDPEALGRALVDGTVDFYDRIWPAEASFSLFRMDQFRPLAEALRKLAVQLVRDAPDRAYEITRKTAVALHYGSQQGYDDYSLGKRARSSVDLTGFLDAMATMGDKYPALCDQIRQSLGRFMIHTRATRLGASSGGLSVYLPLNRVNVLDGYSATPFARDSGLGSYLNALYRHQEIGRTTDPYFSNVEVGVPKLPAGADPSNVKNFVLHRPDFLRPLTQTSIRFDINGQNIIWTKLAQYLDADGRYYLCHGDLLVDLNKQYRVPSEKRTVLDVMPDYNDGTTTFIREITGQNFMISDDTVLSPGTFFHDRTDISKGYFVGDYRRPGSQDIMAVRMEFNTELRIFSGFTDLDGRPVPAEAGGEFTPHWFYIDKNTLDKTTRQGSYIRTRPLTLRTGHDFKLVLANPPDGSLIGVSLTAETMDGKQAFFRTEPLMVQNLPSQIQLTRETYARMDQLSGTYSVAVYARGSAYGTTDLLPTFDTMTLKCAQGAKECEWGISGRVAGVSLINAFNDGEGLVPPQMVFFENRDLAVLRSDRSLLRAMGSFFFYIDGAGDDRTVSLVGIGSGERRVLRPLGAVSQEALQGKWHSAYSDWEFAGDRVVMVTRDPDTGKKETFKGRFVLKDHVMTVAPGEGDVRFALDLDRRRGTLRIMAENHHLFDCRREGAPAGGSGAPAEPAAGTGSGVGTGTGSAPASGTGAPVSPEAQLPAADPMARLLGRWHDARSGSDLEIRPTGGGKFLRLIFTSGTRRSEAVGALSGDRIMMTYADGTRLSASFMLQGRRLVLNFGTGGDFVFERR